MKSNKLQKKEIMERYYDGLFMKEKTFREVWEGKMGIKYRVPKEIGYLISFLNNRSPEKLSFLEIGAGDGFSSLKIIKALKPKRYMATELSKSGVDKLNKMGIEAKQMDATNIKFKDDFFDVVFSFNVIHHVNSPKKMAQEMLRVTKKYFLLCEANGSSIPRKLLEFTLRNRKANENSYLPSTYKSFFKSKSVKWIKIKPFNFTFAFTPKPLFKPAIAISELFEKIPILKWQGSSVLIYGEKR